MTPLPRPTVRMVLPVLCAGPLLWLAIAPAAPAAAAEPATAAPSPVATVLADLPARTGEVVLRGQPLTLLGAPLAVGQPAPDFVAVGQDLTEMRLSDLAGKTVIVSAVPSLDTGVCSAQTRTFNQHAADLGEDVVVVTISMDLPFAQKRWCGAEGVDRVVTLSDYRHWSFGLGWGLRIAESGLLARSVHVVDPDGVVRHRQVVPELTEEPDYEAALAAVAEVQG
jgi:thiol peroxidase